MEDGGYTCVLVGDDAVYTSNLRGVKPLIQFLERETVQPGFSAADKVVGKAAAFLYVLLEVKELYATVISAPALELLKSYGINVSYETVVEMIRNRSDTGYCPMEQATLNLSEPEEALHAIKETLQKLNGA